jgi:hypothetical protein
MTIAIIIIYTITLSSLVFMSFVLSCLASPLAVATCKVSQCTWASDVWSRGQEEAGNPHGVAGLVLNSLWPSFLAHLRTIYTKWTESLVHIHAYVQINVGFLIGRSARNEHEVGVSACPLTYFISRNTSRFSITFVIEALCKW